MTSGDARKRNRVVVAAFLVLAVVGCAGEASQRNAESDAAGKEVVGALLRAGNASRKRGDYGAAAAFYR